jgi:hypothetical protein
MVSKRESRRVSQPRGLAFAQRLRSPLLRAEGIGDTRRVQDLSKGTYGSVIRDFQIKKYPATCSESRRLASYLVRAGKMPTAQYR